MATRAFLFLFFLKSLSATQLFAHGEVDPTFQIPQRLFNGPTDIVSGLNAANARIQLERYLYSEDAFHKWMGAVWGDVALVNFFNDVIFHAGLNMEVIADDKNDIQFRLVQYYYDISLLFEWNAHPNLVPYLGYRHACSHGADRAEIGRILIRSGPEIGLTAAWNPTDWDIALQYFWNQTLFGQDQDLTFDPRALTGLRAQASWRFYGPLYLHMGAGSGLAFITRGTQEVFSITAPWNDVRPVWLPSALLGLQIKPSFLDARVLGTFERVLDTGLTLTAQTVYNAALRVEFNW